MLARLTAYLRFSDLHASGFRLKVQTLALEYGECALVFDELTLKLGLSYDSKRESQKCGIEGFCNPGVEPSLSKDPAIHAVVYLVRGLGKEKLCIFC